MTWLRLKAVDVDDSCLDVLVNADHVYQIEPSGPDHAELYFTVSDDTARHEELEPRDTLLVQGTLDTILAQLRDTEATR